MKLFHNNTEVNFEVLTFPGGEKHVRVMPIFYPLSKTPLSWSIKCNTLNSEGVMVLLLLVDAIRRLLNAPINLTLKYFPYARQDRIAVIGESLSVKVMADIINAQDFSEVTIWDPHSNVTPALINNVNVILQTKFIEKLMGLPEFTNKSIPVLVAPDTGAIKKVEAIGFPFIIANKKRDVHTGEITKTELLNPISEDLLGDRDLLVVDDICDGGRTFLELGLVLRKAYPNNGIRLFVTHGIFSNEEQFVELTKIYTKIYCSNFISTTIPETAFLESLSVL